MFIVNSKDAEYYGLQVFPMSRYNTGSLYDNLRNDENSGVFYASTSFSHLWTEQFRPRWSGDQVEEIEGKHRVHLIKNEHGTLKLYDCRYFDTLPYRFMEVFLTSFQKKCNPETYIHRDTPHYAKGFFVAWEYRDEEGLRQMRLTGRGTIDYPHHLQIVEGIKTIAVEETAIDFQKRNGRLF